MAGDWLLSRSMANISPQCQKTGIPDHYFYHLEQLLMGLSKPIGTLPGRF
jgi:hypothetical protein